MELTPDLLKPLGAAGLVIFILWHLYRRTDSRLQTAVANAEENCHKDRDALAERLREVEDYTRKTLVPLVQDNTRVMERVAAVIERHGTDRYTRREDHA
jgi:hypothetical protein